MNLKYCDNCEMNVEISDLNNPECPQCFETDLVDAKNDLVNETIHLQSTIQSVELTYQSNSKKITIDCANTINVLGRNAIGSELLSEIMNNNRPVISREHCKIEYDEKNNVVTVRDLGSTNGTFIENRLCNEKTRLENQSFLVLGRERFFVNFLFQTKENETLTEKLEENQQSEILYECLECNAIYNNEKYKKVRGYCCDEKLKIKRNG